ncbi:DUF6526 family protein [Epilithonimonas hominis]|uniref:Uncharacterized protein n=1 Tax=Epilithonimonas hominis TaxID=420404 RepID=A0A1H6J0G0_9FLAO|nr:DUF6526 family protein [Epilithonimonas hominis]SEH55290.1 hypothetical protein SAMN05421793_11134 [Epilithonimonas hominis]
MNQNLKNHRKFYPLHHFIFYPVTLALLIFSVVKLWNNINVNAEFVTIWAVITAIIVLIMVLSLMLRQHYALGLQDRIIVNEFKLRYFTLTGNRLENSTYQFSDAQIFALRFAADDELMDLMHQTVQNNWSPSKIKRNIKNWKADNSRV